MKIKAIGLIAASFVFANVAQADELLITQQKKGGTHAIALDYISDGKAAAFEFRIAVPGGEGAKVNLSKCVEGLPKSHTGQCAFAKGHIIGLVYNDNNAPLAKGLHRIGSVTIRSEAEGMPKVNYFLAADASAQKLDAAVRDAGGSK